MMGTKQKNGLTDSQVLTQREKYGYNELPDKEKQSLLRLILAVVREPMIFLLLTVVIVYFFLGDMSEALVLSVSVVGVISLELYQATKTEKALEALRSLASPTCSVVRDGEYLTIPSREVVVGDLLAIFEGGRVVADGRLIEAHNVAANESILTGESAVVDKSVEASDERARQVFSGTIITKGRGLVEVAAIGEATEMGKIGTSLNAITPEKTLLQKEVAHAVKIIAIIAVCLAVTLTLLFWLLRGSLLQGFLAGLTLSIAILPEEFPVVLSVFMALGAWRLAKSNVLARKNQTIETLGGATVLCTDKTGTLTENRMAVAAVVGAGGEVFAKRSAKYDEVIRAGVLASQKNPFDPMEEAFLAAANKLERIYNGREIVKEYPLDETSMSVAQVWSAAHGQKVREIALKGAPEEVLRLCHASKATKRKITEEVTKFARDGLRVLAVARGTVDDGIAKSRDAYTYELLGLVALADPIRKEAKSAVRLAHEAGMKVVMITGDYAETARRIGSELALATERVMTGEEFMALTPAKRRQAVKNIEIYSRVAPTAKLAIVTALKQNGEVVAMTGDGVNDGPALKSAHIGIAMGLRGTDVAREAASLVLLDDNFASIVQGVRIGRRIFANLQKTVMYILIVHIPIAVLSMVPVLLGWPMILLPIHIVFLEFIIDPSCTLVFEGESEEEGAMQRPPRALGSPLFSREVVVESLLVGGAASAVIVVAHGILLNMGASADEARSMTFMSVALLNVCVILAISGLRVIRQTVARRGRDALGAVIGVTIVVLALIYSLPPLRELFKISSLTIAEMAISLGVAVGAAILVALLRKITPRR